MKKLFVYLLITLNLLCLSVKAEDSLYKPELACRELCELGLMHGDENGNLKTEDNVTRAELAALLVRIMKAEIPDTQTKFSDVVENHWAKGYINAIQGKDYVNGYPDGSFCPDKNVLFEEAASVLVKLLGYEEKAKGYGGYPWGTLLTAAEIGITKNTGASYGDALTRGELSQMLLNSLYILPGEGADEKSVLIDIACPDVFFVSPNGSDENCGSYLYPWKTFEKAAASLNEGQTAVFEDGKYIEEQGSVVLNNAQITLRARNDKKALVLFRKTEKANIIIPSESVGVAIKGFDFSQSLGDGALVSCEASDFSFKDNMLKKKIYLRQCESIAVENNLFDEGSLEAENCRQMTLKGNEFKNAYNAASITGASADIKIYNNRFVNNSVLSENVMLFGNDVSDLSIWNNIIASFDDGANKTAVSFKKVKNLSFFNNVISGASLGISFGDLSENIVLRNNIFSKTNGNAFIFEGKISGFNSDYNLYYEAFPETQENNSLFGLPCFVDEKSDWHITKSSIGAYKGDVIHGVFDFTDMDGELPGGSANIGAYHITRDDRNSEKNDDIPQRFVPSGKILLEEDFSGSSMEEWTNKQGDWVFEDGVVRQILPAETRSMIIYSNGFDWTDIAVSADIKAPPDASRQNAGVMFRVHESGKEAYVFRTVAGGVQFAKWIDNSLRAIKNWEYTIENGKYYNFGVEAKGTHFVFYINGERIGEADDDSHSIGSVAYYCFEHASEYDNMKVAQAD